jgi:hypothetical protein
MSEMNTDNKYYIIAVENPESMLLSGMPEPNPQNPFEDDWGFGKPFSVAIEQPVIVTILDGYEDRELLPYFDAEPVMSNEFYQALVEAGVDNMDAYECILHSEDGKVEYKGFKAVNIIGVIRAAGEGTEFTGESRLIDVSMDKLSLDAGKTFGALMFRLAENLSTVVVHERVKRYIEKKGFPSIVFREPEETLVL